MTEIVERRKGLKKVGIVTFSRTNNYGARLQASAMYHIFTDLGYEVEVLNLAYPKRHAKYILGRILNKSKSVQEWVGKYKVTFKMCRFTKNNLNLTREYITKSTDKMVEFINKRKYDAVVCGSDEIWCSRTTELAPPSIYFLPKEIQAKRISFSPSANGNHVFSEQEKAWLKDTLQGYSFVGVRDIMTNELVKSCGIDNGKVMFDPTLYYDFPQVELPKVLKTNEGKAKRVAFAFTRPNGGIPEKLMSSLTEAYGKEIEFYSVFDCIKGTRFLPISPEQFTCVFQKFDVVYTNFFHATIFSLKCNVPVYGIDTFDKYKDKKSKVEDLLHRLELDELFYSVNHSGEEGYAGMIANSVAILNHEKEYDFSSNLMIAKNDLTKDVQTIKSLIEQ